MVLKFIRKFRREEEPRKPYTGATIKNVHISYFPGSKCNFGTIKFKNGGTERFEAGTPEKLIEKMNNFMEIL